MQDPNTGNAALAAKVDALSTKLGTVLAAVQKGTGTATIPFQVALEPPTS